MRHEVISPDSYRPVEGASRPRDLHKEISERPEVDGHFHVSAPQEQESPSPVLAALMPATLAGIAVFAGALMLGYTLPMSLLAYSLVGTACFIAVIALAGPRDTTTRPAKGTHLGGASRTHNTQRPLPPEWSSECVARPVGSIHD